MASGWEVSGAAPPPLSAYTHCGCLVSGMTSINYGSSVCTMGQHHCQVCSPEGWLATSATSPK